MSEKTPYYQRMTLNRRPKKAKFVPFREWKLSKAEVQESLDQEFGIEKRRPVRFTNY